ncbi:hypothetical protein Tco_0848126 [Tanacetum coccineum]
MEKENMKALLRVVTDCKGSDDTLLFKEQMLIQELEERGSRCQQWKLLAATRGIGHYLYCLGKITPGSITKGKSQLTTWKDNSRDKHKEVEDFTLELLSKEAQPVTITDCHAGNPCELEIDLTAKSNSPIIEGMYGQDWKERVTEFGPRSFRRRL